MKKVAALAALMSVFAASQAQSVQTYSVYDTDQSGTINVGDAVGVANQVVNDVAADKTQQYVTAEDLSTMFGTIINKLDALDNRITELEDNLGVGPNTPDENGIVSRGHEYVDLGVVDDNGNTIYWATCNVGAQAPGDAGLYFAWGSTTGYAADSGHSFTWENAPFYDGNVTFTAESWAQIASEILDADNNLLPAYDAATANWGGAWRMPTMYELSLLCSSCYWEWIMGYKGSDEYGYIVYKAKDPADVGKHPYNQDALVPESPVASYSLSDPHIFLPAVGNFDETYNIDHDSNSRGYFWGSTSTTSEFYGVGSALITSSAELDYSIYTQYFYGQSVRPVCQK